MKPRPGLKGETDMKYVYAALFTACEEGGYAVRFPDLPGTNTQGDNLHEALYMAEEALKEWLEYLSDKGQPIPEASSLDDIKPGDGQFVSLICVEVSAEAAVSA